MNWTEPELQNCLRNYITQSGISKKIFLLVDGLDELEGDDEAREGLIDLLIVLAEYENVKLCLSNRPWNIFQDAFEGCPQLKLEDLTYNDIATYVQGQLCGHRRFRGLMQLNPLVTEALTTSLIRKVSGVYLWVRLVMKELWRGI